MSDTASPGTSQRPMAAVSLIAVIFINMLGFGIIVPLLPFYAKSFDAAPWQISLIFSAYAIGSFFGEPFWGRLSDRYGRKPLLISTISGNCLCYLALAFAPSVGAAFVIRLPGGLGRGDEDVVRGEHQPHVERDQLGHPRAPLGERLGEAAPAPGEHERGEQEHPEHRGDESDGPVLAHRHAVGEVRVARLEQGRDDHHGHHADQERRKGADAVDLHAGARQSREAERGQGGKDEGHARGERQLGRQPHQFGRSQRGQDGKDGLPPAVGAAFEARGENDLAAKESCPRKLSLFDDCRFDSQALLGFRRER